jgi:integrative and conjugative element protein (TIGR02256 family)
MTISPTPRVEIVRSAVSAIARETRASADGTETGGILLGTSRNGAFVIRHAGNPGPNATRRPNFFQRDLKHARRLGDNAFDKDSSIWIGDWHTHIKAPPAPSLQDLTTYHTLVVDPELAFHHFIAIIVAAPADDWTAPQLATWVITAAGVQSVRLLGDLW